MVYRSWAEIYKDRLIQNTESIYKFVKKDIFAVVKADAYGHGSVEISKILEKIPYVKKLCVATAIEGKELKENKINKEILVLGGILKDEVEYFNTYNLQPVISDFEQLYLVKELKNRSIHLKFDTGMNRLGFYDDDIAQIIKFLKENRINLEGVMSHFPSADIDPDFTLYQIKRFKNIINIFEKEGFKLKYKHIQNSAGLVYRCDYCNAVRVGITLYGEKPFPHFPVDIKTVMSVKAKLISIKKLKKGDKVSYGGTFTADKDMKIGVVSFGYADGLPRELSNKGYFLINGKKVKILGNVTMDMTIVDLSQVEELNIGDEVLVVGKNGEFEITFSDVANICNTIPYEIMCRISKRVQRIIL
ncbi:alanine racemase [Persephonella sp.]